MRKFSFVSFGVTALIITVLLLSGGANAYLVSMSADKTEVFSGEEITFDIEVMPELGDKNISSLNFMLNSEINCNFDQNGKTLGSCRDVKIKKISEEDIDFGYGYGTLKKFKYRITLDTKKITPGNYDAKLTVKANGGDFSQVVNIRINEEFKCSVRADGGESEYEEMAYDDAKLNFFISLGGAKKGNGYLILRDGRDRFDFKFKEDAITLLNNTAEILVLRVMGEAKTGRNERFPFTAEITVDKMAKTAAITDGEKLFAEDLDVYFIRGC